MSDLAATWVAVGLVLAFAGGALGSRVLGAYRSLEGAKLAVKLTTASMRAARLRWLIWAVIVFVPLWLWIHGYHL